MSFLRGAAWLGGGQVLNLLFTLVSRILLARALGVADFGGFGAALNAMTVGSRVLSFGTASASQFRASRPERDTGRVLGTAVVLGSAAGSIAGVALWLCLPWLSGTLFAGHPSALAALRWFAPLMPIVVILMVLGVTLVPLGKVAPYTGIQVLAGSGFLIPFVALAIFMPALWAASVAQCLVWVLALVWAGLAIGPLWREARWCSAEAREMVHYALRSWPNACLSIGIARVATLLVSAFLSPSDLSLFVLAVNIVEGLASPYAATGSLVLTRAASGDAAGWTARFVRLSVVAFAGLALLTLAFGPALVPLIFGGGFEGAAGIAAVLTLSVAAHGLMRTLNNYFAGVGLPELATRALGVELALLVPMLFFLAPLGIQGLAWASAGAAGAGLVAASRQFTSLTGIPLRRLFLPRLADFQYSGRALRRLRRARA